MNQSNDTRAIFFRQLNGFFDHIYVITLERAEDRQKEIMQELDGLNYRFFFGKDKLTFDMTDIDGKIYDRVLSGKRHRYGKFMQAGQVGCAWSHLEVYKDVLLNNYSKVLILEDDVVIDNAHVKIFEEVTRQLPADWELLYLGYEGNESAPAHSFLKKSFYHVLSAAGILKFSHRTINNIYPVKLSKHLAQSGYHDCTHAYAITRSAAEKLVQLQQPISFVADNLLAHAATNELIKAYVTIPKIINQQYQVGLSSASYLND